MTELAIRNKLVVRDLGDPAEVKKMDAANAKYVLGTIFGIATKVRRRADKIDPSKTVEALVGDFEGVPVDPKVDRVRSGVLYLPEGMFNLIAGQLEGENAAQSVQFAIEVASIKAKNPAGYSWSFTPKVETGAADPLAALRTSAGVKAIEGPAKAPAPATATAKK